MKTTTTTKTICPNKPRTIFSSADHTWTTPRARWCEWADEFGGFGLDAAALADTALVADNYFGPDHVDPARRDALTIDWAMAAGAKAVWLNPPYGRALAPFMAKAAAEARRGATVVALVPSRTDTRWVHEHVFAAGAEVRFLKGRLRFGDGSGTAPFPSMLVVYRPTDVPGAWKAMTA